MGGVMAADCEESFPTCINLVDTIGGAGKMISVNRIQLSGDNGDSGPAHEVQIRMQGSQYYPMHCSQCE